MKKKKKTSPTPFYLSFDELFEKPKLKNIGSRKLKIYTIVAVIAVAFAVVAPFLTIIVLTPLNQSMINTSQKNLMP